MAGKTLKNKKLKHGRNKLLQFGFAILRGSIDDLDGTTIRDETRRVVAYDLDKCIFVAKKELYLPATDEDMKKALVSVDKRIWNSARSRGKKILMYLDDSKSFYVFRPDEITIDGTNKRGKIEMINFSIRNGVNLKKFLESDRGKDYLEARKERVRISGLREFSKST